jgi:hypothetical protein
MPSFDVFVHYRERWARVLFEFVRGNVSRRTGQDAEEDFP